MPQPCKICRHPQREAIDAVLAEGSQSLRVIGEQYGVSKDSLFRHSLAHMTGTKDDGPQNQPRHDDLGQPRTKKDSVEDGGQRDQPRQTCEASPTPVEIRVPLIDRERLKARIAKVRKALAARRGRFTIPT
jgi:hypothetical protein